MRAGILYASTATAATQVERAYLLPGLLRALLGAEHLHVHMCNPQCTHTTRVYGARAQLGVEPLRGTADLPQV